MPDSSKSPEARRETWKKNSSSQPLKESILLIPFSWTASHHNDDDKFLLFKKSSLWYIVMAILANKHDFYTY